MTDAQNKTKDKRILKRQAELLWRLVTTTPGVADLAEPMKRVEHFFERLTTRQRVTVAVIASQLARGFNEIDKEENEKARQEAVEASTAPAIEPDEIIPPEGASCRPQETYQAETVIRVNEDNDEG